MKILIGTPIHSSKDYSVKKWLKNVSELGYPADLLLVDNSPGLEYVDRLKSYCKKYGIKNYRILHLEILQGNEAGKMEAEQIHERITRSEEIIRQEVLKGGYDIWFFWESDILIPADALDKLVDLMNSGGFEVVTHNCWVNDIPDQVNFHFGITLFRREFLEKYSFIPEIGTKPSQSPSWFEAENYFRQRMIRDGCSYTEVEGLIEPVYHLDR